MNAPPLNLLTSESTSRSATVEGLTLRYHEAGRGDPLICIHGGGPGASAWSNYNRNIGALAERFRVIAVDLPCFGESTKLRLKEPRIAFFARIVRGLMDELEIPRAHFVGNSLGGATTMRLAADTPDRAGRLVLMGPAVSLSLLSPFPSEGLKHMTGYYHGAGPSLEKMRAFIEIMVADSSGITEELVRTRFEMSVRPDILDNPLGPPSVESPFEPMWPVAPQIAHETLLVWGREDRVIPVDTAIFLLSQMKNARLHVFPNCGHWAQWEKSDEFNTLVAGFVSGA